MIKTYPLPFLFLLAMPAADARDLQLDDPAKWWLGKSDQFIWDFVPDELQGEAHGTWGCPMPTCGMKIFEGRGHYPWLWHPDRPYKLQCPICMKIYPSNDYQKWARSGRKGKLDTTQKYVDDFGGYAAPDGTRHQFVKIAIGTRHNGIWRFLTEKSIAWLSSKFKETGDDRYAHVVALILAKMAQEYPKMNPDRPARMTLDEVKKIKVKRPPRNRWTSFQNHISRIIDCFGIIVPYLNKGGDEQLRKFLATKGINDAKQHIQQKLCHNLIVSVLEGQSVSGNGITGLQRELADTALSWDMHDPSKGATTEYILDWIIRSGPNSVNKWMYNSFCRDGFNHNGGLGYNCSAGIYHLVPLAKALKPAGLDMYTMKRFREIMRYPINVIVGGKWVPAIGDGGNYKGASVNTIRSRSFRPSRMGPVFDAYGETVFAQALLQSPKDIGAYREKIKPIIDKFGSEINSVSRNFPIFGLAIFESGKGDNRRALSCYYGGSTAHGHHDRLTISIFNRRGPVIPDLGYPYMDSWERYGWTSNTSAHNTVVVDARKQPNREPGHIRMFSVTPSAKALEVDGAVSYRNIVSKYRRTLVWVDVDKKNSYLVDIFRVAGASQYDYSLHGAGSKVAVKGLALEKQKAPTLAGPGVKVRENYDRMSNYYRGSGYSFLLNVEKGTPESSFTATWNHWNDKAPSLRVHVPAGVAEQVFFADGLPPFGKDEDKLRYMFLRNGSCPPYHKQYDKQGNRLFPPGKLESAFVTVLEPLDDKPFIESIELAKNVEGIGPMDIALSIKRLDGSTDLVISREERGQAKVGAVEMNGRVALTTTRDGMVERLVLLDGVSLSSGEESIKVDHPFQGKVKSVDYDAMTLVVPEKLPAGKQLSGRNIFFDTPPRAACFAIDFIENITEGSRIKLKEMDAIIYRGDVEAASNKDNTVILSSAIEILHSGSGIAGMRLCNGDRSLNVRIKRFDRRYDPNSPFPPYGGTAHLAGEADLEKAFTPTKKGQPPLAIVYEFGKGDPYTITPTAWLKQRK